MSPPAIRIIYLHVGPHGVAFLHLYVTIVTVERPLLRECPSIGFTNVLLSSTLIMSCWPAVVDEEWISADDVTKCSAPVTAFGI